ncbi:MAG: LysR family transcriptional regulator [Pseudomonadota bacterium]
MDGNWDDLRVFLAVARAEGLTPAARTLRMDPATVGRRIARLEADCAQPLFSKSPMGYNITEAGARLLPHAEALERAVRAGAGALAGSEGLRGTIRIGAPDGCANFLLPQVCAALAKTHPDLEIQIVALPRVVNLTKREADMAITVSPPETGRLTVQKLSDYALHLAGHRELLASHPVAGLEDLQAHRIVGYIPDMIFDRELDYLAELGLGPARLTSNSVAVQLNLLRAQAGLGVVHDFALPVASDLQLVLPDLVALRRSFYLVRHADDQKVVGLQQFSSEFSAVFRATLAQAERIA